VGREWVRVVDMHILMILNYHLSFEKERKVTNCLRQNQASTVIRIRVLGMLLGVVTRARLVL
jgi:hypothetical protein